tara:strand:+ start:178 stop:1143 length:966 start_codon:yes stop_codon:yes gene_type:complete
MGWLGNIDKARKAAERADYGDPPSSDYWAAQAEAMSFPGRDDMDMSPHNNALRTFYMEAKIDKGLSDKEFGTRAMTEIMDNAEAYFLDKVYDSDGQVKEGIDSSFGFDLRRTGLDDNMDVRSPEYWDKLSTNPINWEYYEKDIAFQAAFKELSERHPDIYKDWDTDPGEDFSFDKDRFGDENKEQSIALIRHANQGLYSHIIKDNRDLSKRRWEGRYDADKIYMAGDDLYIMNEDGIHERQISPSERYGREKGAINPDTGKAWTAQERGRVADAKDMYTWKADKIVGPVTEVKKPDSLNINNIQKVEVKRPANIPASWGAV